MTFFFCIIVLFGVQSEVFAVAFALLAAGAVILTLNVLLLVKNFTIFSPSLSLSLSHCICIYLYPSVVTVEC